MIFLRLVLCFAAALSGAAPATAADRPNVVVFLIDDLGWTDPGCYGNPFHETPHIDQLSKDGVRFTNGYSACTVCSPTREAAADRPVPGAAPGYRLDRGPPAAVRQAQGSRLDDALAAGNALAGGGVQGRRVYDCERRKVAPRRTRLLPREARFRPECRRHPFGQPAGVFFSGEDPDAANRNRR